MSSQTLRRNITICAALLGCAVTLSAGAAHHPPQVAAMASTKEIVLRIDPAHSAVHARSAAVCTQCTERLR